MSAEFVHLHVHSDFSMLDGACRLDRLCARVAELGQKAVAVTDHGNMFAAIDLVWAAKKNGIKPIVGCEFYLTPHGIADRSQNTRHHLVLLAKNYAGYQSLCRLNALAWSDQGFYYKPRIDRDALRQHHADLICLSACVAGEVPQHILSNNDKAAREALEFYLTLFGADNFFLELQYHADPATSSSQVRDSEHRELLEMEARSNRVLVQLAQEYGIGIVATNDVHYLNAGDDQAHDALLCIGTQSNLSDSKRLRFSGDQFYLKSSEQMAAVFTDYPEALANSVRIADMCDLDIPFNSNHYPVYRLPDESDDPVDSHCHKRHNYLRAICLKALSKRYGVAEPENPEYIPPADQPDLEQRAAILKRMDYELEIIDRMGYISYFLVVWDFINYARSKGIPVGPGRGSGAGSLVAYLTGITDLDPQRYGLLFERFLNPDRVSPPDFDIDFCERRRGEVIEYVRNKYGSDSVAQIGTFGTLKAKAVLKDVARVMGISYGDANQLVGMIPTDPKMTLKKALAIPEVQQLYDAEQWVQEVFAKAEVLEGLNRNQSIHACGVIIGDQPLANIVPLARGAGKEWITQFPAYPCEALGMLKMDFLGLKTLTVIQDTLDMVNSGRATPLTADDIPLDDARTYELLNRGATAGVFQLESGGMQELCRSFGISKLEEIIALVALYRPGPMEFIPTFINCKFDREKPDYDTPQMQELLQETYGIMVYQEQIMQVVQAVAGFSLAQADIMRRAIGKKKPEVLQEQGERFTEGCLQMGHSLATAQNIWAKILKFADYGFNKSHSACYGLLSYRTAYLKANFSAEFMAAVLNGEISNAEKMAFYINECRELGLRILPPDVNSSLLRFAVADGVIRFGMGGVKGVGESAVQAIITSRESEGAFLSLLDFCERVGNKVNKRVIESLNRTGAFDCFGLKRSQIELLIEPAMATAQQKLRDKAIGQGSLFDFIDDPSAAAIDLPVPDVPEWEMRTLLKHEKDYLGFYVTGHPLDEFQGQLHAYQTDTPATLVALEDDMGTRVGGLLRSVIGKRSKSDNRQWAVIVLEGAETAVECLIFANAYETCAHALVAETPILVEGHVSRRENEDATKVIVSNVLTLEEADQSLCREIHLHLHEDQVTDDTLQAVKNLCGCHPGEVRLLLCLVCASGDIAFVEPGCRIANTAALRAGAYSLLGANCLRIKGDKQRPEANRRRKWTAPSEQPA